MNFVDEQHVAFIEIGQERGKIARFGDDRARRGAKSHTHFLGHDLRQRRLAQAWRAEEEHMVERIAARLRRLDEDAQIFTRRLLADKFVERFGAQGRIDVLGTPRGSEKAVVGHGWRLIAAAASIAA